MSEKDFLNKLKKQLDEQSEQLDATTLSKLNRSRQAALAQASPQTSRMKQNWLPASGLAAAVLLTSVFLFRSEEIVTNSNQSMDDIEIIAASDNLDLYEQLDFYLWLLEENNSAG